MSFKEIIAERDWDTLGDKLFPIVAAIVVALVLAWVVFAFIDLGAALLFLLGLCGVLVLVIFALMGAAGLTDFIVDVIRSGH